MGFIYMKRNKKGFTLVEILVALSILAILMAAVMMNMSEARKKARDTQRVSDMQQLTLAFRMYREMNSINPTAASGEILGDGAGAVDTDIAPYLTNTIKDPINSGSSQYYYDSSYNCNGSLKAVIYAKTMERTNAGNWALVCGTTYSDGTSANTYGMIIQ